MNHKDYRHLLAYAATLLLLLGCAESEKITEDKPTTEPRAIGFSIDVSQDWYAQNPGTRAILERSQPRHIEMQCSDGSTAYLLETTRTGIDKPLSSLQVSEVPSADGLETRASLVGTDRSGMGSFSSFCYKSDGTAHYLNEQTSNTGALSSKKYWPDGETSLRFYAVHPYDASHFTTSSATALSYAFTSSADVEAQTDLMYASTGLVSYNDATSKQYISLHFKHALTAVRFKLGNSNSNFGKTIKYIKLKNVCTSGTLTLPSTSTDNTTDASATWTNLGTQTDVMLDNIGFEANTAHAGNIITKGGKTEYFLMIPQDLNGVGIEIGFTDDTKFAATLTSGSWTGGSTVQYTISDATLDWTYEFTPASPSAIAYTATSATYGITSYRHLKSDNTTQVPVEWKITGYSTDGGTTYTDTPPAWLTSLSLTSGSGGTERQDGVATIDAKSYITETNQDKIDRDASLKADANAKGSSSAYYDLSTKGGTESMTTANCYVISGYGYYKIPLVHGNLIKNGVTNTEALGNTDALRQTFVAYDQDGSSITNCLYNNGTPKVWLEDTGGTPTSAELVWSDISESIVTNPTIVTEDGHKYLTFEIKKTDIESGNAVVAVKDGSKTIMWSWHLWFVPASALTVIDCTNANSEVQHFTADPLGFKPASIIGSSYSSPRSVKLKVKQRESGNEIDITITQNNGSVTVYNSTTLYQFGRKDAFPGVAFDDTDVSNNSGKTAKLVYGTGFSKGTGKQTYAVSIQNPGTFYNEDASSPFNWCSVTKTNVWSANNTGICDDDNYINQYPTYTTASYSGVVKSVYDPCPAGYKMPGANAWTGFRIGTSENIPNAANTFNTDHGYYFNTDYRSSGSASPASSTTVFFPAAGYRDGGYGMLLGVGWDGYCWSAVPYNAFFGRYLVFFSGDVIPLNYNSRSHGFSVRPVQE